LRWPAVVVVALVAAGAAVAVAGGVQAHVGPVDAHLQLVPSLHGGTEVQVPPLGRLTLRTHAGPLQLRAVVDGIRVDDARALLDRAATADSVVDEITAGVRDGVERLLVRSVLVALAAAVLAAVLVFRRWRAVWVSALSVVLAMGATAGVTAATVNSRALSEPTFTGLLARAPALTGDLAAASGRFDAYRQRIATLTGSVSRLYSTVSGLPDGPAVPPNEVRVLWMSDVHNNPEAFSLARTLVQQFDVDGVVDTGDLTDFGSAAENDLLAPIGSLGVPYLWVRGNHDSATTQAAVAALPNATVLDSGAVVEMAGLHWAGTGDPRYAPSSLVRDAPGVEGATLAAAGTRLANAIDASPERVDVALVHEPGMATPLDGHVPLVLDGHTHERGYRTGDGTLELTQGSSGGAGLRTLEGSTPLPLQMSILHLDSRLGTLLAVDDVTVGGVGESSATVQRHTAESYTDGSAPDRRKQPADSPSPSSTASSTASSTSSASSEPSAGASATAPFPGGTGPPLLPSATP
jgi:predicted phosphodiesterase